jgi:hypothetical protein
VPINDAARVIANGINGVTGNYDVAPIAVAELARGLKKGAPEKTAPAHVRERGRRLKKVTRGLPWGVQPSELAQAGWGIVFHRDEPADVRKALAPLVDHRRRQVGDAGLAKELTYETGETATAWLRRYDVSWNNQEPTKIPYYLLWIGGPERMPFDVTHEVDADYCVGLLHFDAVDGYSRYVRSVIDYETATVLRNTRDAVFFGTRHPFDDATALSADWLVAPLTDGLPAHGATPAEPGVATRMKFRQRKLVTTDATKQTLLQVLAGEASTPSFVFTASHGMVWPMDDPRQLAAQGALLCQDWPGFGSVAPDHYLAAADVPDSANVHGLIAFHFACYGAGTPHDDAYFFERGQAPPPIASRPFVAALPQRLLSHPNGGALACIGHVERAWGCSITGNISRPQIRPFQTAMLQLLSGLPVGMAVQQFNDLSATMSDVLSGMLTKALQNQQVDDADLASTWTQRNDAAGFVLIGDPAVRLRTGDLK